MMTVDLLLLVLGLVLSSLQIVGCLYSCYLWCCTECTLREVKDTVVLYQESVRSMEKMSERKISERLSERS